MLRVLLVDDDEGLRTIAVIALERAGIHTLTAANGREALQVAAAERPDLILLDVMMPELDGPSTLRRLKADDSLKSIPVVYFTATEHEPRMRTVPGVVGVITKPFEPSTLAERVAAFVPS